MRKGVLLTLARGANGLSANGNLKQMYPNKKDPQMVWQVILIRVFIVKWYIYQSTTFNLTHLLIFNKYPCKYKCIID